MYAIYGDVLWGENEACTQNKPSYTELLAKQQAEQDRVNNAKVGDEYEGMIFNEYGFWIDESGAAYEIDYSQAFPVYEQFGVLSDAEQKKLADERWKRKSINHKPTGGIPVFDSAVIKDAKDK